MKGSCLRVIVVSYILCLIWFSIPVAASFSGDASENNIRENIIPAQQGDAQAQNFVAYLYETGQGVDQNYTKAAQWYSKAAQQGNAAAQVKLGNMYLTGKGVPQNYVMAYMWLELAYRQGNKQAVKLKCSLADKMSKVQLEDANRMLKNWVCKK